MNRRQFLKLASAMMVIGTLGNRGCGLQGDSPAPAGFVDSSLGPTFKGLEALTEPRSGLPYDMVSATSLRPEDRIGADNPYKVSGLEIGLALAGLVAQWDLGLAHDENTLFSRVDQILSALGDERATATIPFTDPRGNQGTATFPYKWLDPRTGERRGGLGAVALRAGGRAGVA